MNYKPKLLSLLFVLLSLSTIPSSTLITSFSSVTDSEISGTELVLTLQADEPFYLIGEVAKIFGTVQDEFTNPVGNVTVSIEAKDSSSNTIFLDILYSLSDGTFEDDFRIPAFAPLGLYNVFATVSKSGYSNARRETGFYVFFHLPAPFMTINLGSLAPQSSILTTLTLTLNRFDSIRFLLTILQPVESLTISLGGASYPSKFVVSLNRSDLAAQRYFYVTYSWTVNNVPAGGYEIYVTALSNKAFLSNLALQSGAEISAPLVSISSIEATSRKATPSGTMNYHVYVGWKIFAVDTLNVTAYLEGNFSDSTDYNVSPLYGNQKESYLTVSAPSTLGNYTVTFVARLLNAGVSTESSVVLRVEPGVYNITISPYIQYFDMPTTWEWLTGARSRTYYDDSSYLAAFDVTDIKVISVEVDSDNNPINATIEFTARNKFGSLFHFGDGPHYDIWIRDSEAEFIAGIILAGETKTVRATLVIDEARNLWFEISYRMSKEAEIILLTASAFKAIAAVFTAGLTAVTADMLIDLGKLTALCYYEIMTESERGFMTKPDMYQFLQELGVKDVYYVIEIADKAFEKNGNNPWLSIVSAIWISWAEGHIDVAKFVEAIAEVILWLVWHAGPNHATRIVNAFAKACSHYGIVSEAVWSDSTEKFLRTLSQILSFLELIKIIFDMFTKPLQEGKVVSATVDTGYGVTFDPVISIDFSGPSSNTSLTYFGDVYSIAANVTQLSPSKATGQIALIADPSITAIYLPTISDPHYQQSVFKSLGLNTTSTSFSMQNRNTFILNGVGSMYQGLHKIDFNVNSTWVQGYQEMSADAVRTGDIEKLNCSFVYPFGKNLTYAIRVALPRNSMNITVHSDGEYVIQKNIITWNTPIDWMAIEFMVSDHDVAATDINLSKTIVGQGYSTSINVTVENHGVHAETFNVTAYYNNTAITLPNGKNYTTITLASDNSTTVTFIWNTTGVPYGNYTISAHAWPVQDEADTYDNTWVDDKVKVASPGDVNADGVVNIIDAASVSAHWYPGPPTGPLGYDPHFDINSDSSINIIDVAIVSAYWTGPPKGPLDP